MSAGDVKTNNPAGRLFYLLDALISRPKNEVAIAALRALFEVEQEDTAGLLRGMAYLADLTVATRYEVEALPVGAEPELALLHFDQVEQAIARLPIVYNNQLDWLLTGLGEGGMYALRVASSKLNAYRPEKSIDPDRIKMLLQRVQDLIEETREAADLSEECRQSIIRLLMKVAEALRAHRFLGAEAVQDVLDMTIGAVQRNKNGATIWQRVGAVVVAIDLALNLASNAKELVSAPDPSPAVVHIIEQYGRPAELEGKRELPAREAHQPESAEPNRSNG